MKKCGRRCRDAVGLLAFMTDRIDADFLAACPKLRVIGAALKGFDNIDVQAATNAGVWLTIVPDLLTVPTAELAIGLMLSLGRNIVAGDRNIKKHGFHGWRAELYGAGLAGATVGLVGFGLVGRAIAERLSGFNAGCWPTINQLSEALTESWPHVTMTSFEDVIANSDYVVLALPLTADTRHIINSEDHRRHEAGCKARESRPRLAGLRDRGGGCHRSQPPFGLCGGCVRMRRLGA